MEAAFCFIPGFSMDRDSPKKEVIPIRTTSSWQIVISDVPQV